MATNTMDVDDGKTDDLNNDVDESLYSRQLYVIDHESFKKMQKSSVLICGMNGLGIEIAKNTILAGVKSVTIFDNAICKINDLSSNFYITTDDINNKRSRAQACENSLKTLNPYVKVDTITNNNTTADQLISSQKYDVVALINYSLKECIKLNALCFEKNVKFICSSTMGVFGSIFVDFGNEFDCTDLNGEAPLQGLITLVTNSEKAIVQVHESARHGLSDGDFVTFSEIEGMTELNEYNKALPIKVKGPFAFEINVNTTKFNEYATNGMWRQIKQSAKLSFNRLEHELSQKEKQKNMHLMQSDWSKSALEQHLFYCSLEQYISDEKNNGQYPSPTAIGDSLKVFEIFANLCKENEIEIKADDNEKYKNKFVALARCSSAVINPMCAFLGGVVAQEVLKACSHKFKPIQQFMYFDAYEALPKLSDIANIETEFAAQNCRYDDYIACFGKSIQEKVLQSKMFLIGAGAIGCEMLKNWALMGVACDPNKKGQIYVTDMDQIERSNLNRQFLFRQKDVGKAKSTCAKEAVHVMNGDINITAQEIRVGGDSETVYNYEFWNSLDAVCTALDNVTARLYVDAQCVYYQKPMLESGTLGTKGNTQIVVPGLTESYGSTRDPAEVEFPICTLKNFPYLIQHSIQWARDDFEGILFQIPVEINNYLQNGDQYLEELHKNNFSQEIEVLKQITEHLLSARPSNFEQCVHWARNKFEKDFNHKIRQLLYNFPHDAVTTEGVKFWSGTKRAPNALKFDENDSTHMGYVIALANLRAHNYGLKGVSFSESEEIKKLLANCKVIEFEVNKAMQISANDEEEKQKSEAQANDDMDIDYDQELKNVKAALPDRKSLIGLKLSECVFEKDDDTNFHMDFMTFCSNLRARNYRIKEASKHETAKIAGKIIPAIATTTALVTGLVALEFYKLIQSDKKCISDYRSCFVNLALPLVTMGEPVEMAKTKMYKKGKEWYYSLWDQIKIKNGKDMTVAQLLKYFDDEWDMDVNMIGHGKSMLYAFYMNAIKLMKRKKMKIVDLVSEVCGIPMKDIDELYTLELIINADYANPPDDDEVDEEPMLPTVCLILK